MQDWIIIAIGAFAASGGIFDWKFFRSNRKARFLAGMLGPMGMRVFYVLLGTAFIVLGVLSLTGVVNLDE